MTTDCYGILGGDDMVRSARSHIPTTIYHKEGHCLDIYILTIHPLPAGARNPQCKKCSSILPFLFSDAFITSVTELCGSGKLPMIHSFSPTGI